MAQREGAARALRRGAGAVRRRDRHRRAAGQARRGVPAEVSTTRLHSERVRATTTRRARRRRASPTGAPTLWFLVPALLLYALIVLYPSIVGAKTSAFTDWDGVSGERSWVGLANFKPRGVRRGDPQRVPQRRWCPRSCCKCCWCGCRPCWDLRWRLGLEAVGARPGRRWVRACDCLAPGDPISPWWRRRTCGSTSAALRPDVGLQRSPGLLRARRFLQQDWLGDPPGRCGRS